MAKRTDTKIAVLVQVMDELGFDQETIAKVTRVPLRTINDIANRRGYWAGTSEFNELRDSYRLYLRQYIRDDATVLAGTVLERLQEIAKDADVVTAARIARGMAELGVKIDDRGE